MAKATTRVHLLAKELGVKSKAIIEKCQAEGLDQVKNHMSTISAGLAATIREWFSEGEHATTVETSKRVDLKKVRVKRKKKENRLPNRQRLRLKKRPKRKLQRSRQRWQQRLWKKLSPRKSRRRKKKPKPEAAEAAEEAELRRRKRRAKPKRVKKKKPEPIKPAGPMLEKPKPAVLSGPKVIRVEKIEHEIRPKRRKPSRRPRHDAPITQPLMMGSEDSFSCQRQKGRESKNARPKERCSRLKKIGPAAVLNGCVHVMLRNDRPVWRRRAASRCVPSPLVGSKAGKKMLLLLSVRKRQRLPNPLRLKTCRQPWQSKSAVLLRS